MKFFVTLWSAFMMSIPSIYALCPMGEIDLNEELAPIVTIVERITTPNVQKYTYSDGHTLEIYPNLINAFSCNDMSINMYWSYRSLDKEWWHKFYINNLAFELCIQEASIKVFVPDNATVEHVELISEWFALFPGFKDTVMDIYSL